MRLLQINSNLEGGGAEEVVSSLHRFLTGARIPDDIAVYNRPASARDSASRIICPGNMLERPAGRYSASKTAHQAIPHSRTSTTPSAGR